MTNWKKEVRNLLDIETDILSGKVLHRLERLVSAKRTGQQTIELCVETQTHERIYVLIDIYSADVIRFRISTEPIEFKPSLMLVKDNWDKCEYSMHEDEGAFTIDTFELKIVIKKAPWQLCIMNNEGKDLLIEEREDTLTYIKGEPRYITPPLGFIENEIGRRIVGAFSILPEEGFYGFGEKYTPINKRGQVLQSFDSWSFTCQEGFSACAPFFMSTRGYGIFFHSLYPQLFDVGYKSSSTISFAVADKLLDIFFIHGPSFKRIISTYTSITGRPTLPPKWSFGTWMSRCCYWTREEIETVAERMRKENLPCDVLRIDPSWFEHPEQCELTDFSFEWDKKAFPDHEDMLAKLNSKGFKVCLWIHQEFNRSSEVYKEALKLGYLIEKDRDSNIAMLDLSNADAMAWYKQKLKELLKQGVSTFFLDDGMYAPITEDYKGFEPLEGRCGNSILYSRAAYEAIEEYTGQSGILWGLSGFSGTQRYPALCGGDSRSTYQDMANTLRGGLSAALSGFAFWGCDIGGFGVMVDNNGDYKDSKKPAEELYIHYLQYGTFLPFMNFHGVGEREPWAYGKKFVEIYRKFVRLRYMLIPYIYTLAYEASKTGIPMMRPMILEYQDDPAVINIDLQYMFGDSFLVAPVFRGSNRWVYLPEGDWYHYFSRKIYKGSRWVNIDSTKEEFPVFVKAGSIITMGPAGNYVDELPLDPLILDVYPALGKFNAKLYQDKSIYNIHADNKGHEFTFYIDKPNTNCHLVLNNVEIPKHVLMDSGINLTMLDNEEFVKNNSGCTYTEGKLEIKMNTQACSKIIIKF